MKERLVGVSEETTTGVKQMQESGTLLFHAINVTKSKVYFLPLFPFSISDLMLRFYLFERSSIVVVVYMFML